MTQEEQNPIAHKLLENNVLRYDEANTLSCCLSCTCESCEYYTDCNNICHSYLDNGGLEYLKIHLPEALI